MTLETRSTIFFLTGVGIILFWALLSQLYTPRERSAVDRIRWENNVDSRLARLEAK
jgi:hypothetical protein